MGLVILINKILSGDQRVLKYLLFKLVNTVFLRIFRCYSMCNIKSSDFDIRDCGGLTLGPPYTPVFEGLGHREWHY